MVILTHCKRDFKNYVNIHKGATMIAKYLALIFIWYNVFPPQNDVRECCCCQKHIVMPVSLFIVVVYCF